MRLHGIIPAVLTPFTQGGQPDLPALQTYVDWLITQGVHGLFPCGTNGEGPAMTASQRMAVLETVLAAAAGRVPVVPMTGAISTEETLLLTRHAQAHHAAGAAIVAPWYFPHDEHALEAHFSAVAEAVPGFPLFLYNIPGMTGNKISPALAARLVARYPQIAGIKDSSKSLETLQAYIAALPGKTVIVGTDAMLVEALDSGAAGVVSAIADCFPEAMLAIWDAYQAGDRDRAVALQDGVKQLRDALKTGPYVHPYKLALQWRGVPVAGMRPPLRECTAAEAEVVRQGLLKLGVLA